MQNGQRKVFSNDQRLLDVAPAVGHTGPECNSGRVADDASTDLFAGDVCGAAAAGGGPDWDAGGGGGGDPGDTAAGNA